MTAAVTVKGASLYLSREIYERYFAGLQTVILLRQDDDLLIMPVLHAAAGGYLLKLRNSAGDRVVNAADFFRAQGVRDETELSLQVVWSTERGALVASSAFCL